MSSDDVIDPALFRLDSVLRLPLSYIPGSETTPIAFGNPSTVGSAAWYYSQAAGMASGGTTPDGYRVPVSAPLTVEPGGIGLVVAVSGLSNGGPMVTENPRWPAVYESTGAQAYNTNLEYQVAVALAATALASLDVMPANYAAKWRASPVNTQGQIAWQAVCEPGPSVLIED